MRTFPRLCLSGCLLLGLAACSGPAPAPPPENVLRPTATIKDIMDSIVDPSADALWESVATIVTTTGIEDRRPRTDEEWLAVRRSAVQLVESTNLLLVEGRRVAKPGEKSENPGIELAPEEIDTLISGDRPTFINLARAAGCRAPGVSGDRSEECGGAVGRRGKHRHRLRELPPEVLVSERRTAAAEPAAAAEEIRKLVGPENEGAASGPLGSRCRPSIAVY